MNDLFWLSDKQMRRIEPHVPLYHGLARVDDRKVVSSIIHVLRNALRWRDAPVDCGPQKTIYNRFVRWRQPGVFNVFSPSSRTGEPGQLMIDATHLKAHRTISSLLKKGLFPDVSGAPKAG